jgi:hypothetical protein
MKKMNSNQLKILSKFCLVLAVISLLLFIAFTWRRELEFPSIAIFSPLFIIGLILLSKKAKKEAESSKEK